MLNAKCKVLRQMLLSIRNVIHSTHNYGQHKDNNESNNNRREPNKKEAVEACVCVECVCEEEEVLIFPF